MRHNIEDIDLGLIKRAQSGEKKAQSLLLKCIEPKVRTYIYRMTMDEHIRDDLSQDTLLELVKSLPGLKFHHTNLFWAWLYRTALSKIQRHYRVQGVKRLNIKYLGDKVKMLDHTGKNQSGEEHLLHHELCQAIVRAVSKLQLRYRSILVLRCFDELSYAEVASVMGISEARARLYFFRAKQLLKRHLNSSGFKKNYLLSALGAFAYLTASESHKASAATTLSAGAVKSAWTTVVLGTLTSKTALSILGLVLITAIAVNTVIHEMQTPVTTPAPLNPLITPVLDDSLTLIFDDAGRPSGYTRLNQISRSNHPDDEDWKHFVFYPRLEPARMLKSAIDDTSCSLLVLGKEQWIEYEIPGEIQDRTGPEIAIYLYNWGSLPGFFITDGQSQQMQIFESTYLGAYPRGMLGLGFDLSSPDIPFKIRGIRIEGTDNTGPYGGCGTDPPKISLKAINPAFR
jgi:RNA polymerase sigma-70 factor (ECF subfamily)